MEDRNDQRDDLHLIRTLDEFFGLPRLDWSVGREPSEAYRRIDLRGVGPTAPRPTLKGARGFLSPEKGIEDFTGPCPRNGHQIVFD